MKITTVRVSYGRTFNMRDFEFLRLDASFEATTEEGDDLAAVQSELWDLARADVKAQAMPLLEARKRLDAQGLEATSMVGKRG